MGPVPVLYAIVDTGVCRAHGLAPQALATAYARSGARLLQVRTKEESGRSFLRLAEQIVAVAGAYDVPVIVNDRADIGRMAGAAGVHVGQDDLPVEAVRRIVGPDATVGVSTHDPTQVDEALQSEATYIAVGPVFATTTKETGYDARGLELVRYAAGRGKPVVAIGGVTFDRVPLVLEAGASAVAVISDLLVGGDPEGRARDFVRACEEGNRRKGGDSSIPLP